MKMELFFNAVSILIVSISLTARAENWAQWRGPTFNGVSPEKNLPDRWSSTENVAWATEMPGSGNSTPIVYNDRVYLTSVTDASDDLLALCVAADTGKIIWQNKLGIGNRKIPHYNCTSPSASTDGKSVYFMFGTGDLAGLDVDGNVLWQRNLEKEYGPLTIKWGYGASPLLYKDRLYIPCMRTLAPYGHNMDAAGYKIDSYLLCVDALTGQNIFKVERILVA